MSVNLDKLFHEKFHHPFTSEKVSVQDFTLTKRFLELREDLETLQIDESDLWICTFPKVGTTWAQEMVWLITNNLDFEKAKEMLEYRSPFVDFSIIYNKQPSSKIYDNHKLPPYILDSISAYKSVKSPRVVKTHLPFSFLPKQLRSGVQPPKIISLVRNSKDTCVSFYHHNRLLSGYTGTFDEWCELFLAGKVIYGPYWKHVREYWNSRDKHDMLILKYEDMKKDLSSVIRQVCKFLNRSLTETQIQALTKHLSFDSMRNNSAVNKENQENFNEKLGTGIGKFMRSGKVGSYKSIMSPEMIERFDEMDKKYFKGTDFYNV